MPGAGDAALIRPVDEPASLIKSNPMDQETSGRLESLESNIAHLERQYEQLNEVIVEQGRVIKKLLSQQQRMAETVETVEIDRIKATNAKPPHYQ